MDVYTILVIIGIGLASNLDNAGVGIAYGVRKIDISWTANAMIALISGIATLCGGVFGDWLSQWISLFIAHLLGTIVMVSVGIWVLSQPLLEKRAQIHQERSNLVTQILRSPEEADLDHSQSISIKEAILLGFALSMNAIAGGFDAGMIQLNIWITGIVVSVLSFSFMGFCSYIGKTYAADKLGDRAAYLSGIILILIGLHQII